MNRQSGMTIWLTGLSGSGKTTIGQGLVESLRRRGMNSVLLDGDEIRRSLHSDLQFSRSDREEHNRRIVALAQGVCADGAHAIVCTISPYRSIRQHARTRVETFVEVFVNAPLHICEMRDPKGLYRKARQGELEGLTGIDSPYEAPEDPEVECKTDRETPNTSIQRIVKYIVDLTLGAAH